MTKDILKSMLQNIINENHGEAEDELRQYLVQKTRVVAGLAEAAESDDEDQLNEFFDADVKGSAGKPKGQKFKITSKTGGEVNIKDVSNLMNDRTRRGAGSIPDLKQSGGALTGTMSGSISQKELQARLKGKYKIEFID